MHGILESRPAILRPARPDDDIRAPLPIKEPPVNKQDVVEAVAKRLGVTRARAGEITDLFFSEGGIIASELKRGGKVAISGFGNFELRRRAAREGRNPRTGKLLAIKASIVPAFRAAKALKEMVNRKR
jgi:DNA-binding protein HU-beta